jgi:hypothetical protein
VGVDAERKERKAVEEERKEEERGKACPWIRGQSGKDLAIAQDLPTRLSTL